MRLLIATLLTLGACGTSTQPSPPNLILISLDGLRADRTGAYGNQNAPTPTLDRFASQGIRWEWSFSQANESLFSHAALLVGQELVEIAAPDYRSFVVPDSAVLVSEALSAYGYTTAAFVAGGHVHGAYGFDQGFGTYDADHDFGAFFHKTPEALGWLEQRAREPFFLFLHGYDCHRPYFHPGPWYHAFDADYQGDIDEILASPTATERVYQGGYYPNFPLEQFQHSVGDPIIDPDGYARIARWAETHEPAVRLTERDLEHLRAHYDSGALAADLQVGQFLEGLEARGLLDNTVIVFTADHGEDLGDHGFFNHRALLRDSTTRVPLVIWSEGLDPALRGTVRGDLAQAVDVVPTLLGLAGIMPPSALDGRDLLDPQQAAPSQVHQIGVGPQFAARSASHRLIFQGVPVASAGFGLALATAPLQAPWFELYDLRNDPREQQDVLSDQPDIAQAMHAEMLVWYRQRQLGHSQAPPALDEALQEALRARGYW